MQRDIKYRATTSGVPEWKITKIEEDILDAMQRHKAYPVFRVLVERSRR
ncbi:MAG: hypothetical protein V1878_04130 [bacterium]